MTPGRAVLAAAALAPLAVLWSRAAEPNVGLPVWGNFTWGCVLVVLGAVPIAAALITRSTYLYLPQPIYTGLALACFGVSMAAKSRAGLWLVSPAVALIAAAFVLGYERHAGASSRQRAQVLPPDDDSPPEIHERIRFWFTCALAWVALYEFTAHMHLPGRAFQFAFEDQLPVYPSTSLIYQTTYLAVTIAPWLARTRRDLRRLTISAWVATALVFPFYWLVPSSAPRRPMEVDGVLAMLLSFERKANPPTAAFPSFHVLWSIFIARLVYPAWAGWTYAVLVAVSCITTAMHYIPDVLASLVIAPPLMEPVSMLWRPVRALLGSHVALWAGSMLLGVILLSMYLQSASSQMLAGVLLMGVALIWFVERRAWAPAGILLLSGVVVTAL